MPKISVVCVSNRKGALPILAEDLFRQTFKDYEVVFANDTPEVHYGIRVTDPVRFTVFTPRQKNRGEAWNLNKAYNDCLDRAEGELIVFLQDFIWIPDDGLRRFWDAYQANPNALVTGCGHKALKGLEGVSEEDRRMFAHRDGISPCQFTEWEMNWASCPRSIMPRFDERMDEWYGGENQYIAKKALLEGHEIFIDRDNVCVGYSQDECGGRPADWEEKHCWREGRLAAFLHYLDLTHGKV